MNEIVERLNKLFNGLLVTTFGYEAIDKIDKNNDIQLTCNELSNLNFEMIDPKKQGDKVKENFENKSPVGVSSKKNNFTCTLIDKNRDNMITVDEMNYVIHDTKPDPEDPDNREKDIILFDLNKMNETKYDYSDRISALEEIHKKSGDLKENKFIIDEIQYKDWLNSRKNINTKTDENDKSEEYKIFSQQLMKQFDTKGVEENIESFTTNTNNIKSSPDGYLSYDEFIQISIFNEVDKNLFKLITFIYNDNDINQVELLSFNGFNNLINSILTEKILTSKKYSFL